MVFVLQLPNQVIATPLSCGEAIKSRNAIAKAVYDGLFQMVVRKINRELYKASDVCSVHGRRAHRGGRPRSMAKLYVVHC